MLTSYDQCLDACRELCRAQVELCMTTLQDAARVNAAGKTLIEDFLARQENAAAQVDAAATIEELFDVSANLLGEGISSGTQTVLQMWREIGEVQVRSLNYLPAHAQRLSELYARMFKFTVGVPQPLIPIGSLLFGGLPFSPDGSLWPTARAGSARTGKEQRPTGEAGQREQAAG
jgi:hypothetical protein